MSCYFHPPLVRVQVFHVNAHHVLPSQISHFSQPLRQKLATPLCLPDMSRYFHIPAFLLKTSVHCRASRVLHSPCPSYMCIVCPSCSLSEKAMTCPSIERAALVFIKWHLIPRRHGHTQCRKEMLCIVRRDSTSGQRLGGNCVRNKSRSRANLVLLKSVR